MEAPVRTWLKERKTIIERPRIFKPEEIVKTSFHAGGAILERTKVKGTVGEKEISALFDTGIHPCLIAPRLVEEVGVREIGEAEMTTPSGVVMVKEVELDEVEVRGKVRPEPRAVVTEGIPIDFVVGRDVMEWIGVKLDPKGMRILSNPHDLNPHNPNTYDLGYALTRPTEL